ncbi:hypothetical protein ACFO26_00275 [Lactococcus nasutitermitis]|uniref:Uncharacterized protein n=1 Tax=Lactococcus nasutitermitis TaxID=1652957 RepID=A0ABV9J9N9_9LACT|nr:hypothetical protein [Lactococcus nasutitermitis]
MKAKYGMDVYCDVWKVTRDEKPEDWVQELLDKKRLVWKKDSLGRISLQPSNNLEKLGLVSQILVSKSGGAAFSTFIKAYVGDYFIRREVDGEFLTVSEKKFEKEYSIL